MSKSPLENHTEKVITNIFKLPTSQAKPVPLIAQIDVDVDAGCGIKQKFCIDVYGTEVAGDIEIFSLKVGNEDVTCDAFLKMAYEYVEENC